MCRAGLHDDGRRIALHAVIVFAAAPAF